MIILGIVIAGFTGIIIAVIKLSQGNSKQAKGKASTNKKTGNVIEGRYELIDEEDKIALGHRRLSILELSEAGHQPMESSCGRFVLSFNGEIYNHLDLRKDIEQTSRLG